MAFVLASLRNSHVDHFVVIHKQKLRVEYPTESIVVLGQRLVAARPVSRRQRVARIELLVDASTRLTKDNTFLETSRPPSARARDLAIA